MNRFLRGTRNVLNEGQDLEADYDPAAHRPPELLISDSAAFIHLLKCSLGNGILMLPNAFKRAGYVMSLICSVFMGVMCSYSVILLVRCSQLLCKRYRVPMLDFAKTMEMSFLTGPEEIRKYGKHFGLFTNVIVCIIQLQTAVIYTIQVATLFEQVIEFHSGVGLDIRVYILSLFPIFCSLGFLPNLKLLIPFSIVGFVFVLSGVCITASYLLDVPIDLGKIHPYTGILPVPLFCNIFLFAMHNTTVCIPLENTMKTPTHLPWLIICQMTFILLLNITFGFIGYNKYTESTCDSVIKNLPVEEPLAQWIKISFPLSVMCSFALNYYLAVSILWPMLEPRFGEYKYGEVVFRICGVIAIFLVAFTVPEMVPLLGFLTSFSVTTITLMIPMIAETTAKWDQFTKCLLVKNISITVLWVILMIFGAIEGVLTIISEYDKNFAD